MMATTLLSLILTQLDKVWLSKQLSMADTGYYFLAGSLATALSMLTGPICQAFYPELARSVAETEFNRQTSVYHIGAQYLALALVPVGISLIVSSDIALRLWTTNPEITARCSVLVSVLALGTLLNGLSAMPYNLQVAAGLSWLAPIVNFSTALCYVPLLYFYGVWGSGLGAAWLWVGLNLLGAVVSPFVLHRKLLRGQYGRWLLRDFLVPLIVGSLAAYAVRLGCPTDLPRAPQIAVEGGKFILVFCCVLLSLREIRGGLIQRLRALAIPRASAA